MTVNLTKSNKKIVGEITLNGSKSIANRALIIRALCPEDFPIKKLSNSKDTVLMDALLKSDSDVRDAGAAGTTFRFLTAYLSMQEGTQVLTGTKRMKQRPIGVLVEALRKLGAHIEYLEEEGYPPLKIHSPDNLGTNNQLSISAGTSSQYISALLMIAPTLPKGLELTLDGKIVSRPYIEMTLNLMKYFGVEHSWKDQTITVLPQTYQPKPFTVEADWSGASYYYAMAAFADELDLQLNGLFKESVQGDAILAEMMKQFKIKTTFNKKGVRLTKYKTKKLVPLFEWDFIKCPDLAQTLAVVCGGLGIQGLFSGLETLRIKETDRIAALQTELAKVQVYLSPLPKRFSPKSNKEYFMIDGKAVVDNPTFPTYEDHRMAMAIAPLAMLGSIHVEEAMVVEKSYPLFWEDLQKLKFKCEMRNEE